MPPCSRCEREYDNIVVYVTEERKYSVQCEEESGTLFIDWSSGDVVEGTEKEADFVCPHCGFILETWTKSSDLSLEDAVEKHLKGE